MTSVHDSNRIALRAGLPWVFLGLLGSGLALALWAWDPDRETGPLAALRDTLGAVASGTCLFGFFLLARGRIARRFNGWLVLAFFAWLVEFCGRLTGLLVAEFDAVALRWLCAAAAGLALGPGVLGLWDRNVPPGQVELWTRATRFFAVQTCAAVSLWIAAWAHDASSIEVYRRFLAWMPLGSGHAVSWVLFVGPFAYLLVAIRRSARWVDARASITEVLHG